MSIKEKKFKLSDDLDLFSESVEVIKEIIKKRDSKRHYKISKRILKLKNNRIIIVSRWISKDKLSCSLCPKHIRISPLYGHVDNIDYGDRSRCFIDPLGKQVIVRFKNSERAKLWENRIERFSTELLKIYSKLSSDVYVINEANDMLEGKIMINISGVVNGSEMKKVAEERFNMHGLLSQRYSLEIQCGKNVVAVVDEMPIFYLNEFLSGEIHPMFCSQSCSGEPTSPKNAITLIIMDKANSQRKNFQPDKKYKRTMEGIQVMYNIEERWHGDLIPTWLLRLLSDIYFYGPFCKGIFRVGSLGQSRKSYYEHMLTRDDFFVTHDLFLKANILKYFLTKIDGGLLNLPGTKITDDLIDDIEAAEKFLRNKKKESQLITILRSVPQQRFMLLQHLLVVLKAIATSDQTLMGPHNLGLMLSPAIFNGVFYANIEDSGQVFKLSMLTECIILLYDKIVDPSAQESIVTKFSQYQSEPSAIDYSEPPEAESSNNESYLTDDSPDSRFDGSKEDQENIDLVTIDTSARDLRSSKSRICIMGSMLFERLNNSAGSACSKDLSKNPKSPSIGIEERESSPIPLMSSSMVEKSPQGGNSDECPLVTLTTPRRSTRHASLMGASSVTSTSRHRRKPIDRDSMVRRTESRNSGNRSRSPYVKNMVEMYERRLRSPAGNGPSHGK